MNLPTKQLRQAATLVYAVATTLLPLLIQQHVISAAVGLDIGATTTALVGGLHGGIAIGTSVANAAAVVTTTPTVLATVAAPAVVPVDTTATPAPATTAPGSGASAVPPDLATLA